MLFNSLIEIFGCVLQITVKEIYWYFGVEFIVGSENFIKLHSGCVI